MDTIRRVALAYAFILGAVSLLNFVPGITDAQGSVFGIFALDIYDDLLHAASAAWALVSAILSRRASETFLKLFGSLYLADGVMGLITGVGFLDLGIFVWGWQSTPFVFKLLANLPHLLLGGCAVFVGFVLARHGGAAS